MTREIFMTRTWNTCLDWNTKPRNQSRPFLSFLTKKMLLCVIHSKWATRFSFTLQYMAGLGVQGGETVTCFVSAEIARGQPQLSLQPPAWPGLQPLLCPALSPGLSWSHPAHEAAHHRSVLVLVYIYLYLHKRFWFWINFLHFLT